MERRKHSPASDIGQPEQRHAGVFRRLMSCNVAIVADKGIICMFTTRLPHMHGHDVVLTLVANIYLPTGISGSLGTYPNKLHRLS